MRFPLPTVLSCALLMAGCSGPRHDEFETTDFDHGWRFTKGDVPAAQYPGFNDSGWTLLDLPHDWSIEGPFDKNNPAYSRGAWLPAGRCYYRKTFSLPAWTKEKKVLVYFGGVYRNSEVWINGNYLGRRPSGYSSFYYDLTPHLTYPGANVITVKVDNSAQPGSRWYSGTGIYRDVRLLVRDKLSIPIWGTAVTTPVAEADRAEVSIASTIANDYPSPQTFTFGSSLLDADGRTVARVANQVSLARARLFFCTGRYRRLSEGRIILLPITVVRAADRASLSALELGRQGRRPYPGGMFLQLRDLLYVECSVTDRAGNLVPKADNMLQFRVEGPASIVGVENGDQFNQESFKADHRRAFNGKCLAIIKSSRRAGLVTFSAYSAGLETATTTIAIH